MKIIDFIKNNKVPTIVASVVLVAAIAVGIAFGVINHKDKVETKPFGDESSSEGSSSTISVPPIEDNSSKESASSEESTSSASETIETNSTPSKAESVSSTQTSSKPTTTTTKPTSSKSSNTTPSTPVTSTPSNSTGGNTGTSKPSTGGNTSSSTPSTSSGTKEVKIGNTYFTVNLDSPYGICSKCGLNRGMILGHDDYTCEQCGKTCCEKAFFRDNYDGWVCPYCNYAKEREKTYCPNCGRVIGIEKGQCGGYTDPFTNKWVCQDN